MGGGERGAAGEGVWRGVACGWDAAATGRWNAATDILIQGCESDGQRVPY